MTEPDGYVDITAALIFLPLFVVIARDWWKQRKGR